MKRNLDNLARLKDTLDTLLDPEFTGLIGLNFVDSHSGVNVGAKEEPCGSFHCVLGWYNKLNGVKIGYGDEEPTHFGITELESSRLFHPEPLALTATGDYSEAELDQAVGDPGDDKYNFELVRKELDLRRDFVTELLEQSHAAE